MRKVTKFKQQEMEVNFSLESWENTKSNGFDILASGEGKKHLFKKLGYGILKSGELIDLKTKEKVKISGKNDEFVNLDLFPKFALISGSHHFVKNLAEYYTLLAEKGESNLTPSTKIIDNN